MTTTLQAQVNEIARRHTLTTADCQATIYRVGYKVGDMDVHVDVLASSPSLAAAAGRTRLQAKATCWASPIGVCIQCYPSTLQGAEFKLIVLRHETVAERELRNTSLAGSRGDVA